MLLNQLQQLGAASHREIPGRWQAIVAAANFERRLRHLPEIEFAYTNGRVPAYVNRGAWVADCPNCNGGIAVSPEWTLCCCLDCGRIYDALVPPDDVVAAATVLLECRPVSKQNWIPATEQIAVLQAENIVHGLAAAIELDENTAARFPVLTTGANALLAGDFPLSLLAGN